PNGPALVPEPAPAGQVPVSRAKVGVAVEGQRVAGHVVDWGSADRGSAGRGTGRPGSGPVRPGAERRSAKRNPSPRGLARLGVLGGRVVGVAPLGGTVGGLAIYGSGRLLGAKKTLPAGLIAESAKRGPLEVVVIERGNLESSANVQLTCKVEGTTTIIKIVEEG